MTDPNKNESTAHKIDLSIIIERYLKYSFDDQYHRYKSWEHCFAALASNTDHDFLALHLGFYLASWGMYRGSSGLLQKSYQIHNKAVAIIKSKHYQQLQCNATHEITTENIPLLFDLKNELAAYYASIGFTRGKKTALKISATDTLISKVLLGTLGCVPAFDRYFCTGLKQSGIKNITFEKKIAGIPPEFHKSIPLRSNQHPTIDKKTSRYLLSRHENSRHVFLADRVRLRTGEEIREIL